MPEPWDRIGKLVPRLASPHDGEVIATVRATGRTLKAVGLDLHAMAARLSGSDTPPRRYAAGEENGVYREGDGKWFNEAIKRAQDEFKRKARAAAERP